MTESPRDRAIDEAARRIVAHPAPATLRAGVVARLTERTGAPRRFQEFAWKAAFAAVAAALVVAVAVWGLLPAPPELSDRRAAAVTQPTDEGEVQNEGEAGPDRLALTSPDPMDGPAPPPSESASPPIVAAPLAVVELAVPDGIHVESIGAVESIEVPRLQPARNILSDMAPLAVEPITITPLTELALQ